MIKYIKSVRGMDDILPEEVILWRKVEEKIRNVISKYGYREIRLPIVENTAIFKKSIGEHNDIVGKEIYNFLDKSGNNLALRPEGTTGCVRSGIEHGLLFNQEQRFWYMGPMFRYERPQKGRYRQFYQIGVESFGQIGPDVDFDLILLTARCWKELGIENYLKLEINSIGSLESQNNYCKELISFLNKHKNSLEENYIHLIRKNPMRILDTKDPNMQKILNDAPNIIDHLDKDSKNHFYCLCNLLDSFNIKYTINKKLVRGLDYYNNTIFEWVTSYLGSQNAVCGGGRYDNLTRKLGFIDIPAIGFAIGLERLILLLKSVNSNFYTNKNTKILLITEDNNSKKSGFRIAEKLRDHFSDIHLMLCYGNTVIRKQFNYAKKNNINIVLILRNREILDKKIIIKNLYNGAKEILCQDDLIERLNNIMETKKF